MPKNHRFALVVGLLMSTAALAQSVPPTAATVLTRAGTETTGSKFLYPVPSINSPCYQFCSSEEAICSAKVTTPGRQCDDAMRLCVQRCDPQVLNSIVLDEIEERRNTRERGEAFQNGVAGR